MISFRYHLVSLVAVFLALALGIGMGVTVIDKATVDLLERNLRRIRGDVRTTNLRNDELQAEIDRWNRFGEQSADELLGGRLQDVTVVPVAGPGIRGERVSDLVAALERSGAIVPGTLWFTSRMDLTEKKDRDDLGKALGIPSRRADLLRQTAIEAIANSWRDRAVPSPLPALEEAAFVKWVVPDGSSNKVDQLPIDGMRVVVVAGATVEVPNEQLAVPFVVALAESIPGRLLAAEPSNPDATTAKDREVFVGAIRSNNDLRKKVSTVDNLEHFRGRVATVLALQQLPNGVIGHFGTGAGSDRLVPETRR